MTVYDEPGVSDGKGGPHPLAGVPQQALDAAYQALEHARQYGDLTDETVGEPIAHAVLMAGLQAMRTPEPVIARSDTPARVKIMEPRTGTVLIINKPGTNEPMVSVNEDGTLTIGEGYTPDAAAREFWDALAQSVGAMWPYLPHAKASDLAAAAERERLNPPDEDKQMGAS